MRRRLLVPLAVVVIAAPLVARQAPSTSAGNAQARIKIDLDRTIGTVDPLMFGNFAEHLGRMIYGGIYDEKSPLSDQAGFRRDVLEAVKGLGVSILRWPGGNFASGYDWKDGIGPKDQRPARPELAWNDVETNRFGTDEFLQYAAGDQGGALHLRQPRAGHHRRRARLGRVHQQREPHLLGGSAAQERPRSALQREVLGARQRNRRAVAARAQERGGVRDLRARGGQGDARHRSARSS